MRLAAPAAVLLAATIAILLVRAALRGSDSSGRTATVAVEPGSPPATGRKASEPAAKRKPRKSFYVIESGDTLGLVATRFGTTVDRLLALNPGVDPHALRPGQRVRIR